MASLARITLTGVVAGLAAMQFSIPSTLAAPIAATGWNADFILGIGELHSGHQEPVNGNIWFAENSTVGTPGLPSSGAVTAGGVDFQFQPYTNGTSNSQRGPGALTLSSPDTFSTISLLGSVPGSGSGNMVLNFSDAASTPAIPLSFIGWTGTGDINPKLTSTGTTTKYNGGMSVFTYDLVSAGLSGFTLNSITFGGGGARTVFALGGDIAAPAPDTFPPAPNPLTFVANQQPGGTNGTTITMTATTASDVTTPVEYEFVNLTNGNTRPWDTSPVWTDSGLTPLEAYDYQVRARDSASPANIGDWSATESAVPSLLVSSYTYEANAPNDSRYPDTGGTELSDGALAPTGAFANAEFAGFNSIEPLINFDLGSVYDVGLIDVTFGEATRWAPSEILVSSSTDGVIFSPSESFLIGNGSLDLVTATLDVSSLPAGQFYRLELERAGQWIFLSEVDFFGGVPAIVAVPEPASIAIWTLLGLALTAFGYYRARRIK